MSSAVEGSGAEYQKQNKRITAAASGRTILPYLYHHHQWPPVAPIRSEDRWAFLHIGFSHLSHCDSTTVSCSSQCLSELRIPSVPVPSCSLGESAPLETIMVQLSHWLHFPRYSADSEGREGVFHARATNARRLVCVPQAGFHKQNRTTTGSRPT